MADKAEKDYIVKLGLLIPFFLFFFIGLFLSIFNFIDYISLYFSLASLDQLLSHREFWESSIGYWYQYSEGFLAILLGIIATYLFYKYVFSESNALFVKWAGSIFIILQIMYFLISLGVANLLDSHDEIIQEFQKYEKAMVVYKYCIGEESNRKFVTANQTFDEGYDHPPSFNMDILKLTDLGLFKYRKIYPEASCLTEMEWAREIRSYKEEIYSCLIESEDNILIPFSLVNIIKPSYSEVESWKNNPDSATFKFYGEDLKITNTIESIKKRSLGRVYTRNSFQDLNSAEDINVNWNGDYMSKNSIKYFENTGQRAICSTFEGWYDMHTENSRKNKSLQHELKSKFKPSPRNNLDEYIEETLEKRDEIKKRLQN